MPKKSTDKKRALCKKAVIMALIVLFLLFYLVVSFVPRSKFTYEVMPQNGGNARRYFFYEPFTDFNSGTPLNISFTIAPKEIEKNILNPITRAELVLSTQLENSSVRISYDSKAFMPDSVEADKFGGSGMRIFHLNLPLESKTIKVVLNGNYPQNYAKNFIYIHAVQRNYYITEKADKFLGEQTQDVRY